MRRRRARRKAVGTRASVLVEAQPNAHWFLDFVQFQLACGQRFRTLNVVYDLTRECLAAISDTSISWRSVARQVCALIKRRGRLGTIVSDNDTKLTSKAILTFATERGIEWRFHRTRQADGERVFGKLQLPHAG